MKRREWMRPRRFAKHTVQQTETPEVPQIRSLSQLKHQQRSAQRPISCCGVMSVVDHSNQHRSECSGESRARAHAHEFPQLVQPLRASQSRRRSTSQTTIQRTKVPDHHGRLLFCVTGAVFARSVRRKVEGKLGRSPCVFLSYSRLTRFL